MARSRARSFRARATWRSIATAMPPPAIAGGRKKPADAGRMIALGIFAIPRVSLSKAHPSAHKAVITCALNGVLTDPRQHPVPVTPEEMASEARAAFNAGATVMHVHCRSTSRTRPSAVLGSSASARKSRAGDRHRLSRRDHQHDHGHSGVRISGSARVLGSYAPEMAACNAGSLNYLKVKADGTWAWPPMVFDNGVDKVERFLEVIAARAPCPSSSASTWVSCAAWVSTADAGLQRATAEYNFVMGVESGMPADPGPSADPAQADQAWFQLAGHRHRAARTSGRLQRRVRRARRHAAHRRWRTPSILPSGEKKTTQRTNDRYPRAPARGRAGRSLAL